MRTETLINTARAAGFAMAASEDVFEADPVAIAPTGVRNRSTLQSARVALIRSRARLQNAHVSNLNSTLRHFAVSWLPGRAPA